MKLEIISVHLYNLSMPNPTPVDLRQVNLFAGLSDATLQQIAARIIQRTYPAGDAILQDGDPCSGVYFILSGQVRIYRLNADGREQVLVRMGAGQAFNTVPPLQSQACNHSYASAEGEVSAAILRNADYLELLQTCPDFALTILHDFADRLDHLTNLVEDLGLRSVRARLARFLIEQADAGTLSRGWTQDEIAAHLGTVRDMVSRTLRVFNDAGLIRSQRQSILLLDRRGLEQEAKM